jgi:hypothetical protein
MAIDLAKSRYWDRQLERGLPDCRLSALHRERRTFVIGRVEFEYVYCAQCGEWHGGGVTANWSAHVFFLCDRCVAENGAPPECVEVRPAPPAPPERLPLVLRGDRPVAPKNKPPSIILP